MFVLRVFNQKTSKISPATVAENEPMSNISNAPGQCRIAYSKPMTQTVDDIEQIFTIIVPKTPLTSIGIYALKK